MAKLGRPTKFNKELGAEICERLSTGESLRSICRDEHIPNVSNVIKWLFNPSFDSNPDMVEFRAQYAQARINQMHFIAEELLEIADDGTNDYMMRQSKDGEEYEVLNGEHIQRSRLRVDTRKWLLSKVVPKVYGDKVTQEITGKDGGAIETTSSDIETARAIAFALKLGEIEMEKQGVH